MKITIVFEVESREALREILIAGKTHSMRDYQITKFKDGDHLKE